MKPPKSEAKTGRVRNKTIRLSAHIHDKLRRFAWDKEVGMADLVEGLIEEAIENDA